MGLLVAIPLFDYWHRLQSARQSQLFLEAAKRAEEANDWQHAEASLRCYVELNPDQADAYYRLGRAIENASMFPEEQLRAVHFYSQAVDHDPAHVDAKLAMAGLLVRSNPPTALKFAEEVLQGDPRNPAALRARASALDTIHRQSAEGKAHANELIRAYEAALAENPHDASVCLRLSTLLRDHAVEVAESRHVELGAVRQRADAIVDAMVEQSPRDRLAQAHLLRRAYRQRYGLLVAPEGTLDADLKDALRIEPENHLVLLSCAEALLGRSSLKGFSIRAPSDSTADASLNEAVRCLEKAKEQRPRDPRPYLGLAEVMERRGDVKGAIAELERGLAQGGAQEATIPTRLADLFLRLGRWDDAKKMIEELDRLALDSRGREETAIVTEQSRIAATLLRARWLLDPNNPARSVVKGTAELAELARMPRGEDGGAVDFQLGQCQLALGEWDLAVAAFKNAEKAASNSLVPSLYVCQALQQAGRLAEAEEHYQVVLERLGTQGDQPAAGAVWVELARVRLGRQLERRASERDWAPFQEALKKATALAPNSPLPIFLELEYLRRTNPAQFATEAEKRLVDAEPRYARSPEYWALLFELGLARRDWKRAEASAATLEALVGKTSPALRARLALARGDLDRAGSLLDASGAELPKEDKRAIEAALADRLRRMGQEDKARAFWERWASEESEDPKPRLALAQMAFDAKDDAALLRWTEDLKRIEGENGTLWRFAAILMFTRMAERGRTDMLPRAESIANDLRARRSDWSAAHFAAGLISELRGRFGQAAISYREAYRLGEPDARLARRILGLQLLLKRTADAREFIHSLPDDIALSPIVAPLAFRLLEQTNRDEAIKLVTAAETRSPGHLELTLLRGEYFLQLGGEHGAAALDAFRDAVRRHPERPAAWASLLGALFAVQPPDATIDSVRAAGGLAAITEAAGAPRDAAIAFVLGRSLELVRDWNQAENQYRRAVTLDSSGTIARWLLSSSVVTLNSEIPPDASWTAYLGLAPRSIKWEMALYLAAIGSPEKDWLTLAREDASLKASAFTLQGGGDRRRSAIDLLETLPLEKRKRGDLWLLARLYRLDGNDAKAAELIPILLEQSQLPADAMVVAEFAASLQQWPNVLSALDRVDAGAAPTAESIDRRCDALAHLSQSAQGVSLVEAYLNRQPSKTDAERWAGDFAAASAFRRLGQEPRGLELLERGAGAQPSRRWQVLTWQSQSPDQVQRALEKGLAMKEGASPVARATILARIRAKGVASAELDKRLEECWTEALKDKKAPGRADLLLSLAILREFQRRPADALALTRQALEGAPANAVGRNNLAWLLAGYEDKSDEALTIVNRLIVDTGPSPAWLDTKGIALLNKNRAEEATRLLEESVLVGSAPASSFVHLAEAYAARGPSAASRAAAAVALKLGTQGLPPRDWDALQKLARGVASTR